MPFSPDIFDTQLAALTDPSHGVVAAASMPDVFLVEQNPPQLGDGRPVVVVTGPSRAGKNTIFDAMLATEPRLMAVQTATTRDRRPEEAADAMLWMRPQRRDELLADYHAALVDEYELVEHDPHHGALYGIPRRNLDGVPDQNIPLLNIYPSGIRTLRRKLVGSYAVISIMVCPESAGQLQGRMVSLMDQGDDRLEMGQRIIDETEEVANFVIVNRTGTDIVAAQRRSGQHMCAVLGELGCFGQAA